MGSEGLGNIDFSKLGGLGDAAAAGGALGAEGAEAGEEQESVGLLSLRTYGFVTDVH